KNLDGKREFGSRFWWRRKCRPGPLGPGLWCLLEHELQSELNNAWIAKVAVNSGNAAEAGGVVGRRAWQAEVEHVEDVEELGAELHVHAGAHPEVLEQPHIPGLKRRPVVRALGNVAPRAGIGGRTRGAVEPDGLVGSGRRLDADAGQLGAIAAETVERSIRAARDRERPAGLILPHAGPLPAPDH